MDNISWLKADAIKYLRKCGILQIFQSIAYDHSINNSKESTPLAPLILHGEIDLVLLFDYSRLLYEKVVEYPAEGRRIFREAIIDSLSKYLADRQCPPISCTELLLRCKCWRGIDEGEGLFARHYGSLSYMEGYVLTSVTISRSRHCNESMVCTVIRCSNKNCPGHSGKNLSTEELCDNATTHNCDFCGKKCYEDVAGRGIVRKVMAKFTPVAAFNGRKKTAIHFSLDCSITEPLIDKLQLGDMYDIWGHYNVSVYELWGLKPSSFFPINKEITFSSVPRSIQALCEPENPWIFVRTLSLELGSNIYRKTRDMSLKMGLILSLATLGTEKCCSIACVGPNVDLAEKDIMRYAANCADRSVSSTFPLHGNIIANGERTWHHSGSLVMAKTGVCYVGDWKNLKPDQQADLEQAFDNGYLVTEEKNAKITRHEGQEFFLPQFPFKTAVWTYLKYDKQSVKPQSTDLENLVNVIIRRYVHHISALYANRSTDANWYITVLSGVYANRSTDANCLFGIPFLMDTQHSLTAKMIHDRLEVRLNGEKLNPRKISADDLAEYLRIVNGVTVKMTEEAEKLIKDYFAMSRNIRKNRFPSKSATLITALAEAHTRLSLRIDVTCDDVVAVIYLYEESMCFLYGYATWTLPPFAKTDVGAVCEQIRDFKSWLERYLTFG